MKLKLMDLVASSMISYSLDTAVAYSLQQYSLASVSAFLVFTSLWYHSTYSDSAYYVDQVAIQLYVWQALYEAYWIHWIPFFLVASEVAFCKYLHRYQQNHTHILIHVTSAIVRSGVILLKVYRV